MNRKLSVFVICVFAFISHALQIGSLPDETPVAITDSEYAGNVSLVSLAKAQAIADGLSDAAALKMYNYGDPNQVMTPDAAFDFDAVNGLITNYNPLVGGLDVVIPYEIGGVEVKGVGNYGFSNRPYPLPGDPISSVVFPRSVDRIELGGFLYCTNLTSVVFNGDFHPSFSSNSTAFYGCTKLKSVTFPNATRVPFGLFNGSGLESFNGPNVEMLGSYVFLNCTALTNVLLPSATYIGKEAFKWCSSLVEVSLPLVEHFGETPFTQCSSLMSIRYESDCPVIDNGASGPDLAFGSIPATNYVDNANASGWGNVFGGRPVVRGDIYADDLIVSSVPALGILSSPTNWIVRTGLTGTNVFDNSLNRPQAWSGAGELTVSEFTGMQPPVPVYWTLSGFDGVTLPSSVYLVGGGSWQTNAVNHFTVWSVGTNVLMNFITSIPEN